MKDRIKAIQTMTQMSQQDFAKKIGVAPGSLSSVYSERIQPTNNYVFGIHKAFPNIDINWLMFGEGEMYVDPNIGHGELEDHNQDSFENISPTPKNHASTLFDEVPNLAQDVLPFQGIPKTAPLRKENLRQQNFNLQEPTIDNKNFDTARRQVKEIRVFFDDGTYETFVPGK